MQQLVGSVGLGGRNHPSDVATVQRLLTRAGAAPGPVDQRCGILTIQAIEHFQHGILSRPDGRVDVDGPTWKRLQSPGKGASGKPSIERFSGGAYSPGSSRPPVAQGSAPPHPPARSIGISAPAARSAPSARRDHPNSKTYWETKTPLVPWSEVNRGLQSPPNRVLLALLGEPTGTKTTNLIVTAYAGSLHVTGLRPAVDSLRSIMARVSRDLPDLYGLIRTPGMRAVRAVRGRHNFSNHSWGVAIDLRIGGILVPLGARYSVKGIDALVPYFNAAGWFWGGGYHGRKDAMHFECSTSLLQGFRL